MSFGAFLGNVCKENHVKYAYGARGDILYFVEQAKPSQTTRALPRMDGKTIIVILLISRKGLFFFVGEDQ